MRTPPIVIASPRLFGHLLLASLLTVGLNAEEPDAGDARLEDHPAELRASLDRFRRVQRVIEVIEREYATPVDRHQLWQGALRGLTSGLDPHCRYFSPAEYALIGPDAQGRERGFGFEWTSDEKTGRVRVLRVFVGSSAYEAGLFRGDHILAVGDRTVFRLDTQQIRTVFLHSGDETSLRVRHADGDEEIISLIRRPYETGGVIDARLLPGQRRIAYVRLDRFVHGREEQDRPQAKARTATARALREALDGLTRLDPEGLILDLRGNGGGSLLAGVEVADCFLDGNASNRVVIVTSTGRRPGRARTWYADGRNSYPRWPLVVLVDEATASTAELVCAALKDHGRALVVGATTAGKDTVQQTFVLSDGGALRLTVARYRTPSDVSFSERGHGVEPDIATVDDGLTRLHLARRRRARHLGLPVPTEASEATDGPLRRAREALEAHLLLAPGLRAGPSVQP